jgi:hypothetical protein
MSEVATQSSNHAGDNPILKVRHGQERARHGFWGSGLGAPIRAERRSIPCPYSPTPNIPITIPLISEIRPRHHTPALLGTGVPSVL